MASAVGLAEKSFAVKTRMPYRNWCSSRTKLVLLAVDGRAQLLTAQASASLAGVRGDVVNAAMAIAVGLAARPCAAKMRMLLGISRLAGIGKQIQLRI
jgi:hypothetical protein